MSLFFAFQGGLLRANETPKSAVGPLMKLFQSGRLPLERTDTVVEMICKRGNEEELQVVLERILASDRYSTELQEKTMAWLTDAAVTRKVRPSGNRTSIENLIVGPNANKNGRLQQAAIQLASVWRDEAIVPALLKLVRDPNTPLELQLAAIEGLKAIGNSDCQEALRELASQGGHVSAHARELLHLRRRTARA